MHFSFNNVSKHKQQIFYANLHHLDEVTTAPLKILAFVSSLVLWDGKIKNIQIQILQQPKFQHMMSEKNVRSNSNFAGIHAYFSYQD